MENKDNLRGGNRVTFSIGRKIFYTYALLSFLGFVAIVIAWFGLRSLDQSHRMLALESTPVVLSAYRLSASVRNVVDLVTQEAIQTDEAEAEALDTRIDRALEINKHEVLKLKEFERGRVLAEKSESVVEQLHQSVIDFRKLIGGRFAARRDFLEAYREVIALSTESFALLKPELVKIRLETPAYKESHIDAVNELSSIGDALSDILAQLPSISSEDRLRELRSAFAQQIRKIADSLVRIEDPSLRGALAIVHGAVLNQLESESGLFESKSRVIVLDAAVRTQEALNIELEGVFSRGISELIAGADELIAKDYREAEKNRENTQQQLLLIDILLVISPLIILYFYLRPRLIKRLDKLVENTRSIASGDLEIPIDTSGTDELSQMAQSLDQFRGDLIQKAKAEAELLASEERFRLLGELATDGYWDWDLETNEEYLSPSFKRLFGYEDHEMKNHASSWQKIIHPDDLKLAFAAYEGHTQRGEPFNLPVRYYHKEGRIVWVICRGIALKNEKGEFYRMVGTHTDITKLKRIEEELAKSNQELEQFAFVASHDLQEPLRTISGYVRLIERGYADKLDSDGREFVAFIVKGTQRMKDLINALLDYSRLGQGDSKIVPVDMGKILDDLIEVLQTAITEKEATITLVDRLPVIHADRLHMQQLLQNLLSNALKFSRHGISPEIEISCKEGTNEIGHVCWKFSVKDNGIGIKEEYFEKAQMIFQRLNDRDAYEGTGIGLAICKRIVERHQGFLSIESAEGIGSTFHFHLPKHPNSPTLQA